MVSGVLWARGTYQLLFSLGPHLALPLPGSERCLRTGLCAEKMWDTRGVGLRSPLLPMEQSLGRQADVGSCGNF